jgi:hypothetical protein
MDWVWTENPFGSKDQQFIFHQHDFVALDEYEESWLDDFLHRIMYYCNRGFLRVSLRSMSFPNINGKLVTYRKFSRTQKIETRPATKKSDITQRIALEYSSRSQ